MRLARILPALVLAIVLSACSSASLQQLKGTEFKGSPFQNLLATHYRNFAAELQEASDIKNAERFAKKGLAAAAGEDVPPEDPAEWALSTEALAELAPAHAGLLDVLTPETTASHPEKAAFAQYTFDRWLKRAADNGADAEDYKQRFIEALAELAARSRPEPEAVAPDAIRQTHYVILFGWNSTALDKEAIETLKRAFADSVGSRSVVINGHTDTSGSAEYNMALSLRRAEKTGGALVDFGTLKELIETFAFGETDPKVKTGDGVREHANRRVEITINR